MPGVDLRARREAIVREHMESENAHDFDTTIATFRHHADDAVIVEFDLLGTHLGPLRALPPTGRAFRCRMSAHFVFDGWRGACRMRPTHDELRRRR
jgi:hypothetical protein